VFSQIADIIDEEKIELPLFTKQVLVKFFPGFDEWTGSAYLENTESINADYLEKLSAKLFDRILKTNRILLYIDDLQWMDPPSLRLLLSLVNHVEGLVFVATLRNEYSEAMDHFIAQLYKYDRIVTIPLERFSRD
jgi:predicted ATPase